MVAPASDATGRRPAAFPVPGAPGRSPMAVPGPDATSRCPAAVPAPDAMGWRPTAVPAPDAMGRCPTAVHGPDAMGWRPTAVHGPDAMGRCPTAVAVPDATGRHPARAALAATAQPSLDPRRPGGAGTPEPAAGMPARSRARTWPRATQAAGAAHGATAREQRGTADLMREGYATVLTPEDAAVVKREDGDAAMREAYRVPASAPARTALASPRPGTPARRRARAPVAPRPLARCRRPPRRSHRKRASRHRSAPGHCARAIGRPPP
jgi:hypothetical protein